MFCTALECTLQLSQDQNSAEFHFIHILHRDLAVFSFQPELTTPFKLLEIYDVHLLERKKETLLKVGLSITFIITLGLSFCPDFSSATADLQAYFCTCSHPAPPALLWH